jgi:hypothetical protein
MDEIERDAERFEVEALLVENGEDSEETSDLN